MLRDLNRKEKAAGFEQKSCGFWTEKKKLRMIWRYHAIVTDVLQTRNRKEDASDDNICIFNVYFEHISTVLRRSLEQSDFLILSRTDANSMHLCCNAACCCTYFGEAGRSRPPSFFSHFVSPFFRRGVHGQDYVCSLDRARFRSLSFACPVSPAKLHEFVGDYTAAWQYLLLFMGWPKESQLQHGARTIF